MKLNKPTIVFSIYYKIIDSFAYGGKGTSGYASVDIKVKKLPCPEKHEIYVEHYRKEIAENCEVPIENVERITDKEYKANTN